MTQKKKVDYVKQKIYKNKSLDNTLNQWTTSEVLPPANQWAAPLCYAKLRVSDQTLFQMVWIFKFPLSKYPLFGGSRPIKQTI